MAAYALAAGLLLTALISVRHQARWFAAFACSVVMTVALWGPFHQEAEITFLDVGHGDAAFIRTPGGSTLLIDTGDNSGVQDMGKRVVGPFLWSNGVTRLDAIIISHPDRDHIGGARYILEHFEVGALFLGPIETDTTEENKLLKICASKGVPIKRLARGDTVGLKGAALEVLHPPSTWSKALPVNETSLVLRLAWPGMSVLFPGDAEELAERALTQENCAAQILKVPHHGSKTSSSQTFIDAVQPQVAIVSVGRRGRRSVLSSEVMTRYEENDVAVLRTDIAGGIRITSRDGQIVARTARGQRGYPMRLVE